MRAAFAGTFLTSTLALAAQSPELPPQTGFLFWTPAQQRIGYRNIEKIFPTRTVKRVDPKQDLIIVTSSAWPSADDDKYWKNGSAYFAAVTNALRGR